MNSRFKILVATLVLSVSGLTWTTAIGETPEAHPSPKLDDLLKQRQETLTALVDVVTEEYRQGTGDFESVVRATDQLLAADLELAKNSKERIAILERRVELMNGLLESVSVRFRAGQATRSAVLTAKAAHLYSQIQLAREQADGDDR